MPLALQKFLAWATDALGGQSEYTEQEKMFIVPGVARALAAIFKLGKRAELLEVAERLWADARDLADSPAAKASTLTRKLACKLTQRIGLLFLKPRVVSWRYDRGARSLEDNLKRALVISQGGDADAEDRKTAEMPVTLLPYSLNDCTQLFEKPDPNTPHPPHAFLTKHTPDIPYALC